MRNYFSLCVWLFLMISCKSTQKQLAAERVSVRKLKASYSDRVSFIISNESYEAVKIESMKHYYIEKEVEGGWTRVPYTPCQCGTPCLPAGITSIPPGEKHDITWNLISRKCVVDQGKPPVKTIEEKVSEGNYRMTFIVNRTKNGMREAPEELVVSFSIN